MIRVSKISTKFANTAKKEKLDLFLAEYNQWLRFYIDAIWAMKHSFTDSKGNVHEWDVARNKYKLPKFCPLKLEPENCNLSARAIKCVMAQAMQIVSGAVEKWNRKRYVVSTKQKEQTPSIRKLQSWIDVNLPTKPTLTNDVRAELNSICLKFVHKKTKEFDGFMVFASIGKSYGKIIFPVKMTKHSQLLASKGELKSGFLVGTNHIDFRYEFKPIPNTSKLVIGADVGQTTVLTLSDGSFTTPCKHGHTLKSINAKMAKKKPESRAAQKALDHSINHINWALKQLDLGKYGTIRLESNKNIKKGRNTSKSLKHWSWSRIHKSITSICEEHGVRVELQSPAYKSQRCFSCGYVHKSNRNGKTFRCRHCGFTIDADMNGAKNNSIQLSVISRRFMAENNNRGNGFFWSQHGVFSDKEFTVPYRKQTKSKS